MTESENPEFILIISGSASGKNYQHGKNFSGTPLVDMDQISKKLTVDGDTRKVISKAIAQANAELKSYFESGKSVAQVTTGSGAKAVSNKVELAHSYGFDTHLVLVDTDIERAINRNRKRTDSGVQTSVPDWKIEKTDLSARQTFKETRRIATKSTIIKN